MVDHSVTDGLTGGCQCGAIRYSLSARPEASICHCRMCQKAMGGPIAALGEIGVRDLTWTRGVPALFASSAVAKRGFCAGCGTPLTYQGLDTTKIEITLCSLDDPAAVTPTKQVGIEGRLPWFDALSTLPTSPTHPKYQGLVSFQHPDHETGSNA